MRDIECLLSDPNGVERQITRARWAVNPWKKLAFREGPGYASRDLE